MGQSLFIYFTPGQLGILDGVTMAKGAGISLLGMFQLATDKTFKSQQNHCRSDVRLQPLLRSVARAVALATVC